MRLAVLTVAHSHPIYLILAASLEIRETVNNLLASIGSHRLRAKTMRACAGAAANTTYCTGELVAAIPVGCATLNVQGTTYSLF
jgi:hypothetical protein